MRLGATLDAFFLDTIGPPSPDEADIRLLVDMILDDDIINITGMAHDFELAPSWLRWLADRHFRPLPELLRLRARFLRMLVGMMNAARPATA